METIELTGQVLHPDQVAWLARETGQTARIGIAPAALARATATAEAAERIAIRRPVYGRTTGVGANRTQHVADGDLDHGLRLLRSHASGIGHLVSPAATRAMLIVRANQLLAGGAGLRPEIIEAIIAVLNADLLPEIHEYGGLGTADLTALAELGLALVGEGPWITTVATAAPVAAPTRQEGPGAEKYDANGAHDEYSGHDASSVDDANNGGRDANRVDDASSEGDASGGHSASSDGDDQGQGTPPPADQSASGAKSGRSGSIASTDPSIPRSTDDPQAVRTAPTGMPRLQGASGPQSADTTGDAPAFHGASGPQSARITSVDAPILRGTDAPQPISITSGDALALMSSSALTIGRACLEWRDTSRWVHAAHSVAALTHLALDGSMEAFSQAVHDRRPHRSLMFSAAIIRALLAGQVRKAARIQDPFGLRCIPQVHGAALASLESVEQVLAVELNSAAENPLISVDDESVYHHGGFHQSLLTQSLDTLKLALLAVGQLSLARLDLMFHPEFTGLRPFLADGEPASSGVMILENAAHDALAELRNAAMPAGLGHAVLSRGVEDHTPFTSQAARQASRAGDSLQLVLATELVGAMRTLRLRRVVPANGTPLDALYTLADVLDPNTADRSTTSDVHTAASLLPQFADIAAKVLPAAWPHPLG